MHVICIFLRRTYVEGSWRGPPVLLLGDISCYTRGNAHTHNTHTPFSNRLLLSVGVE